MTKKTIAVIFGGQSSEHEVSCMSAVTIISHIDAEKYDALIIGITKEGRWIKVNSVEDIKADTWRQGNTGAIISPDATIKGIMLVRDGQVTIQKVDAVFPVLHGPCGEDGTIQGLFELAKIPYVGCGVLSSAVSMDKLYTKIIAATAGVNQARYVALFLRDSKQTEEAVAKVEAALPYPVFVKPSNAGSSRGVSKATDRESLIKALELATTEDYKILVEEMIIGRELECAVFRDDEIQATGVGEILAAAEFYDYEAKYHNAESKTVIDPELPDGKAEEIRQAAMNVFRAVDGMGLSRVDFFLENETNRVIFNEINTLPGFTAISMYPMLWEAKGVDKTELVSRLIESAWSR